MGKKLGVLVSTAILALFLSIFLFDDNIEQDKSELDANDAKYHGTDLVVEPSSTQLAHSTQLQIEEYSSTERELKQESLLVYREINATLFNALTFTDECSYQQLLAQGFPSEKDILFAQQYSTTDLAQGLIGTVDSTKLHAQIEQDPEISRSGLVAIGFTNALLEYETAVRYYHPTYRIGDSLTEVSWPNDEIPALVAEQFDNLNYLQAAAKSDSVVGKLVKAKFDIVTAQLTESKDIPDMALEFLASAQRELRNTAIADYVEANYPQHSKEFYTAIQALEPL